MRHSINPNVIGSLFINEQIREPGHTKGTFSGLALKGMAGGLSFDGTHPQLDRFFKCPGHTNRPLCIPSKSLLQLRDGFGMKKDRLHLSDLRDTCAADWKNLFGRDPNHFSCMDLLRASGQLSIPSLLIASITLVRRGVDGSNQPRG